MSSSESRIGVLVSVFLLVVLVVIGHLFFVMVVDHDVWLQRSHRNRWAFRSVPSMRGAVLDRFGKVLAHDEPTMEVSLYYLRFRLRHPVGAAVHGATVWARTQPGREETTYSYLQAANGPSDAARDLLAVADPGADDVRGKNFLQLGLPARPQVVPQLRPGVIAGPTDDTC